MIRPVPDSENYYRESIGDEIILRLDPSFSSPPFYSFILYTFFQFHSYIFSLDSSALFICSLVYLYPFRERNVKFVKFEGIFLGEDIESFIIFRDLILAFIFPSDSSAKYSIIRKIFRRFALIKKTKRTYKAIFIKIIHKYLHPHYFEMSLPRRRSFRFQYIPLIYSTVCTINRRKYWPKKKERREEGNFSLSLSRLNFRPLRLK